MKQEALALEWIQMRGEEFKEIVQNATMYFEDEFRLAGLPNDLLQRLGNGVRLIALTQAEVENAAPGPDEYMFVPQPNNAYLLYQRKGNRVYQFLTRVLVADLSGRGIFEMPFILHPKEETLKMITVNMPRIFSLLVKNQE